jgi:hypothetical protein
MLIALGRTFGGKSDKATRIISTDADRSTVRNVQATYANSLRRGTRTYHFDSTKPTELRFRALLTEGAARVHFHREGFSQLKKDLA